MAEPANMEMFCVWKFDGDAKRETNIQIDSPWFFQWTSKHSKDC